MQRSTVANPLVSVHTFRHVTFLPVKLDAHLVFTNEPVGPLENLD